MNFRPALRSFAGVLAAGVLGGCAERNLHDDLVAVPVEQVVAHPAVHTEDRRPRVGIAFGGGGVRGFAHLGVLRALDEAGIHADIVTGSSVGAIVAALYASGMSVRQIEALVMSATEFELLDPVFSREGILNGRVMAERIRAETGHRRIEDLPLPLGIAVTDLGGERSLLAVKGDLGGAVVASAGVPGVVVPVQAGGATYVDGGVLTVVPIRFARAMGADVVIGIDIFCGHRPALKQHALDTMIRTLRLQSCLLSSPEIAEADVLIRPQFEPANATSFSQREAAVRAGYDAARAMLPMLRKTLEK
jgi:NTE family protein